MDGRYAKPEGARRLGRQAGHDGGAAARHRDPGPQPGRPEAGRLAACVEPGLPGALRAGTAQGHGQRGAHRRDEEGLSRCRPGHRAGDRRQGQQGRDEVVSARRPAGRRGGRCHLALICAVVMMRAQRSISLRRQPIQMNSVNLNLPVHAPPAPDIKPEVVCIDFDPRRTVFFNGLAVARRGPGDAARDPCAARQAGPLRRLCRCDGGRQPGRPARATRPCWARCSKRRWNASASSARASSCAATRWWTPPCFPGPRSTPNTCCPPSGA
ncbi:hypothetical protein RA210_U10602 [Rubrivivax sp. A210]|nr:hypothetical protein RA210_U10602 [Rubrivivax sp. A210]